ncbi:pyruvate carboxylase subunit B [Pelotomaculum isophthalicicum JI]|uniref:Pyruvate carboxylase subunit B n=1 Tax=Pelotomaculum isophthalicicum JI TaxID=947010 RepID=A0A9X4GZZ1_9FIRM|nr:pyruvate carboxylase subunit B [Pelotomaculum isophthalicicum]MDF9406831.1 pyruvate carboxylase subunit B [Pelotomaculum isophthalicicum JI]
MTKIKITDTTLRDGHQSLLATRMRTEHMLPILDKHDAVGFHSLEMWGGATFDTCMRFCGDDPWERLKEIRQRVKTPLQMLLRGQNVVGYRNYADDVLTEFIKKAVSNGMDIFRIFDALNDTRNMEKAIEVVIDEGAHAQATVVYTISPVHNTEYYVKLAKTLESMGAHSICIKDMAGILAPYPAYEIIKAMKDAGIKIPIQLHCHYTSGMGAMAYLKAIEAGVDVIDCAISTMALQTSQPAIETMCASLAGTGHDPGFDFKILTEIAEYWKKVREQYAEFDVASKSVDTNVMVYQIPGGMMSNFISQLSQQNALHRLPEVLEELPRARQDFGYPPLVTPTSQIVGTQAVMNVLLGRYKVNTSETIQYMRGYYGRSPAPVNEEVRKKIIGDEQPITCRPADMLEPELPAAKELCAAFMEKEEDIISCALYPQVAPKFLEERMAGKLKVDFELAKKGEGTYPV